MGSPPAEGSVRRKVARGTLINAAFMVGLQLLGLFKGFIIAGYLTATDYGIWGLLVISLGTLLWLAQIGIDDKYIQQDHPDQEKAFHLAFTLQCMLSGLFMLILVIGVPVFALLYHQPQIIAPGLVLTLAMPTAALDTPLWVFYRKMDFLQQRRLAAWDPLVSFFVTIILAVGGAGYWSLVIGTLAGAWAGALVAVRHSPYKLRLYYEKGTLRDYASFSTPIFVQNASGVLIAQLPVLFVQRHVGTAAVGAITLAGTISLYTNRVDTIVTQTLYPAIARAKGNIELLFEAFTKSNRLALMWGMPCGVGVALFTNDLVRFGIGLKWAFAIPVIQVMAITAGVNQFGFNWGAFYKAKNNTRPIAASGVLMLVAVLAFTIPLTYSDGVRGYAYGMAAATAVLLAQRAYYLAKLFPNFGVFGHAARAIWPTAPAVAAVLLMRLAESGLRTRWEAGIQLVVYALVVTVATLFAERRLLQEVLGYLRRRPIPQSTA